MGINSYITHRMFVAALSHDEDSSRDASQDSSQRPVRHQTAKDPWDVHIDALAKAKQAARGWGVSRPAAGH